MVSAVDLAKRAFIKVLLQLAATYAVKLSLSRDSPADVLMLRTVKCHWRCILTKEELMTSRRL